jgi:hypothetical protein
VVERVFNHDAGVEGTAWGVEAELVHRGHQRCFGRSFLSISMAGVTIQRRKARNQHPGRNGAQASVDLQRLPGPRASQAELEPQINGGRSKTRYTTVFTGAKG